jgi:hypothetical protein
MLGALILMGCLTFVAATNQGSERARPLVKMGPLKLTQRRLFNQCSGAGAALGGCSAWRLRRRACVRSYPTNQRRALPRRYCQNSRGRDSLPPSHRAALNGTTPNLLARSARAKWGGLDAGHRRHERHQSDGGQLPIERTGQGLSQRAPM